MLCWVFLAKICSGTDQLASNDYSIEYIEIYNDKLKSFHKCLYSKLGLNFTLYLSPDQPGSVYL